MTVLLVAFALLATAIVLAAMHVGKQADERMGVILGRVSDERSDD